MLDVVWSITALVCWLAAMHRLWIAVHTGATLTGLSLAGGLVCLAVGFTIQITVVRAGIDRVGPRPETAQHLAQLCVLGAAFSAQAFLILINHPARRSRRMLVRRALVLAIAGAILVTVFLSSSGVAPALEYKVLSARGFGAVYLVTYAGYIAVSALDITRLSWRYARWADRDYLRLGLQAVSLGGAVSVAYATAKIVFTVVRTYQVHQLVSVEWAVIVPLMISGGILLASGLTFPAWGPRIPGLPRLVGWQSRYRCYRLLYPLWKALVRSAPEIVLHQSSTGLRSRLYRRVIEINDGLLTLRPYRDPRVEQLAVARAADDLDATARQAVVEAATITCALRAKADGHRFAATTAPPAHDEGDLDLDGEAQRLQLVALAFRHSPIVAAVTAEVARFEVAAGHTDHSEPLSPTATPRSDKGELTT